MSTKSPAYRWYPRDILGSLRVAAMTASEECWYRRALDFAWLNDGLPADPAKLSRIIGKKCTVRGAEAVLSMFVPSPNDPEIYVNERQEMERQKQKEWSEKSAQGGRNSRPTAKQTETNGEPPLEPNPKQNGTLQFAFASSFSSSLLGSKKQTGEEFLAALRANPNYAHIDLDVELARAEEWARRNKRQFNRRFITNWLDRIEPPLRLSRPEREKLPTAEEKEAEARSHNAAIKRPPKAADPVQ